MKWWCKPRYCKSVKWAESRSLHHIFGCPSRNSSFHLYGLSDYFMMTWNPKRKNSGDFLNPFQLQMRLSKASFLLQPFTACSFQSCWLMPSGKTLLALSTLKKWLVSGLSKDMRDIFHDIYAVLTTEHCVHQLMVRGWLTTFFNPAETCLNIWIKNAMFQQSPAWK